MTNLLLKIWSILVLTLCVIHWTSALKILTILPVYGRSHYFAFKGVVENLALRGHDVTFIAPFATTKPIKNLEYVTLELGDFLSTAEQLSFDEMDQMLDGKSTDTFHFKTLSIFAFKLFSNVTCSFFLNSNKMQEFIKQPRDFDLVIAEAFHTDCFMPFAHHFQAPLVLFSASAPLPWFQWRLGQPANPSYVPNVKSGFANPMNFWERMQNMFIDGFHCIYYDYIQEPKNFQLAKKFFSEKVPTFAEIAKNYSLLLTNSHFSIMGPRATVPGIIEVGGIHIRKQKPLPEVGE